MVSVTAQQSNVTQLSNAIKLVVNLITNKHLKTKNGRPYWIFRFKSESNNTVTNYTYRGSDSYISPLVCRK